MTLRARLLLAFLALALIPTAVLTLFTLDRLERSLQLWNTPGVDRALESALESSKTSLARMEATTLAEAGAWAERLGPGRLPPARRAEVAASLRAAGLDFLQVYRREGGGWRLEDTILPPGVLGATSIDLSAELEEGLAAGRRVHSKSGALAGLAPLASGELVAAGMMLHADYFEDLARVGDGVGFYRRFGVVRDVSRAYLGLLVVVLVLVLALAALWASTVMSRGLTRPLSRLGEAVERVAGGDLQARVEPEGAREVVALGRRFNAMTERLGRAQQALIEAEREAAWREVAKRLAHEFKNILTPMTLSLHRLSRRAHLVPEDQRAATRESLDALTRGVEGMTRLTHQFAEFATLPEPRLERLDLDRLVREAVRHHEHEGVTVRVVSEGEAPWVRGDSLLLARAVHNLVLNACEAVEPGSDVDVRVAAVAGEAVVEVLDRGEGLAPDVLPRLFEPYVSTKQRGSGLGLSLVRDIATQHRGTITLENREGGGARARLVLPRDLDT